MELLEEITEAILAFVNATTMEKKQQIVEQQHALLLTDETDQAFATLLQQYQDDEQTIRTLEHHRTLLHLCREIGIEQAFALMARLGTREHFVITRKVAIFTLS